MLPKGKGWGGINWEFEINRYNLYKIDKIDIKYIKYLYKINSNNLVYNSTGNYIQYLIITYNGKESEKDYICLYMNQFAGYQKHNIINQLYFNEKQNKT